MQWKTPQPNEKETSRVEAFSDGVFGIAATLLVLNIVAPAADTVRLGSLKDFILSPSALTSFAAYVVSFLTILVMWINHHSIFQYVTRLDRLFLVLNGLLLLFVVFVNYPTALVSNFIIGSTFNNARVAAMVYSATLIVIAALYNALWFHAAIDRRLMSEQADQVEIDHISRQYRFGWVFYVASFVVAIFSPYVSVALTGALALYFAFTGQIGEAERRRVRGVRPSVSDEGTH